MANQEQLAILRQGVEVWNKWRSEHLQVMPDLVGAQLNGASLSGARLYGANLASCDLMGIDLSGANLNAVNLYEADLSKANLTEAILTDADLSDAVLVDANLTHANLTGANFWGTKLSGVNFSRAVVGSSIFGNSDLTMALALEQIDHHGPSTIGTDCIAIAKGKLPEIFLRGCGLSDWEIETAKLYRPGLSNEDINKILYRMYDLRATRALQICPLFISYSHADAGFVNKLENNLNSKGVRFWRDIHDMKAGSIEKQIDRAIRQNPTVLLILSENSLKSDWVQHEVRSARELEKATARDVLCPIALDESWKDGSWPKRIMEQVMEYNILDFSIWREESKFEATFNKLIDGLQLFYK